MKHRSRYAELHCKSNFSFLEGASHPDELVRQAAHLEYAALAVTDRNSLAGAARAHTAAKDAGLKLLVGAEVTLEDAVPAVLLATDRPAYSRLSRLLTVGRRRAEKGQCRLCFEDVAQHADGLLALLLTGERHQVQPPFGDGDVAAASVKPAAGADSSWRDYKDVFADRCYLLVERHRGGDDERLLEDAAALSKRSQLPLVAANDVHYHVPDRQAVQDTLTAIREVRTVDEIRERLFSNGERYLKHSDQMDELFAQFPDAVRRTMEVAGRCQFSLDELRYEYPEELCPAGMTPFEHLSTLAWRGARKRYPSGIPAKVRTLIEHELRLIRELRYEAYFLTVWDLVRFARSRDILCQGRGSAANSTVCYCLGVTSVDPDRIDLLFERFVSRERDEAPDIDVDFEHERREEVLQYIYDKYGRERAGMTAEVICYRPRSAVRDVGKALGLSLDRVDKLAKSLEGYHEEPDLALRFDEAGLDAHSDIGRRLIHLVNEICGFPRHLSQHVGGMVITHGPLCELVPIENASMADRTVIQWNKDDLDDLGILKVDCLGLGMLTAIRKCFDLIKLHGGPELTLANVPPEDPVVYDMICRADTVGVFQIESRAQMSMLPRLKPRCFYDLVIEVAIVRPGPIQGDMVHPYLRRRMGKESVEYPNDEIREVLHKTLGVPLFQEQAMRLAVVAAGFTPGEADQLRRAMGAWRRPGIIDQFRQKLLAGMKAKGLDEDFAERVFRQIQGFGEYGFPESHAASFALLVYVSCWLKRYHPAAFCAAVINSQPMGFYAPAQLVRDAQNHGVCVLPVDVNHSNWDCTLEPITHAAATKEPAKSGDGRASLAVRLGLRMLSGLAQQHADAIVACRSEQAFRSLEDFTKRTKVGKSVQMRLSEADAFASLKLDRRQALWHALDQEDPLPLFASSTDDASTDEPAVALPEMSLCEQVIADYQTAGLSLKGHPMKFVREQLDAMDVVPAARLEILPTGRFLRIAGIVLLRQRPSTAHGVRFVTLEDETGQANLIVRPTIWERYHLAARAPALLASGKLEKHDGVTHVLVSKLEDASEVLAGLRTKSRDFR